MSWSEKRSKQRQDVIGFRIAAEHCLREDQGAVDVHVKYAAGARDQFDCRDSILERLEDPRRQTDGVWPSASGNAILDPDVSYARHVALRRYRVAMFRVCHVAEPTSPLNESCAGHVHLALLLPSPTGGTCVIDESVI